MNHLAVASYCVSDTNVAYVATSQSSRYHLIDYMIAYGLLSRSRVSPKPSKVHIRNIQALGMGLNSLFSPLFIISHPFQRYLNPKKWERLRRTFVGVLGAWIKISYTFLL